MAVRPAGTPIRDPEVLVVGGGIAGLAAALLLARIGRSVTLLERNPHPAEVGAALVLQPNGLAVLEALDLGASVRAHGRTVRQAEFRNHRSELISHSTMPDFGGGLDHYVVLLRTDLHAALLAAVHSEPAISTRFGVRAVGADPTGSVRIDTPLVRRRCGQSSSSAPTASDRPCGTAETSARPSPTTRRPTCVV